MKIFVLTTIPELVFSPEQKQELSKAGTVVYVDKSVPLGDIEGLLTDDEKIVAIDPDFWEWTTPDDITTVIPKLKAVCLQSTSFSWVNLENAKKSGVPITNCRGFSSISVAEWATMMVLTLARKMPLIIKNEWKIDYDTQRGIELRGKTAGIIGLGRIGTAIAQNMKGLGMNVQYWSKKSDNNEFKEVSSLEELIRTSDVILPALAKNDETKGMITDAMLNSMKKSAIFVSIVHEVYNHELLLEMAEKGTLNGYGFEEQKGDFMKYKGNVWAGPELAWYAEESVQKNSEQWIE